MAFPINDRITIICVQKQKMNSTDHVEVSYRKSKCNKQIRGDTISHVIKLLMIKIYWKTLKGKQYLQNIINKGSQPECIQSL